MFGVAGLSVYSAAKAAVVGLTKSLAREFGPDNIRVNAIAPGAVITERQRRLWMSEEDIAEFRARQCLNRTLVAEDVARLALFLASDDSAMITKQCLLVDGGLRLTPFDRGSTTKIRLIEPFDRRILVLARGRTQGRREREERNDSCADSRRKGARRLHDRSRTAR